MSLDLCLEDLSSIVRSEQLLLLGEVHGTNEFPKLVGMLADRAAEQGQPIVVGLEVPMNEDLSGEVRGPFWNRRPEYLDGRSSIAMAELVEHLRLLARSGAAVEAVAMDGPWVAPGSPVPLEMLEHVERPRHETMALNMLSGVGQWRNAVVVILAGSEHTTHGPGRTTTGSILARWYPRTISLLGVATGGEAWSLTAEGPGVHPVPAADGLPEGASWADAVGADGRNGYLNVGVVTASLPFTGSG